MKKIRNLLMCATAYFSHIAGMKHAASDPSSRMTELFNVIKEHKNEEVKHIIAEFPVSVNTYHDYKGDSRMLFGYVTPLHVAVSKNNAECVELLLACKADCNAQATMFGYTPLYMALFHFHRPNLEVAQALIDAGADINERLLNNRTLLHQATMSSWIEKRVMFLLKNGADRTLRDDKGETALEFSQARDSDLAMITLACFKAVPEQK